MLALEVAESRFEGGAAFHPFPNSIGSRCPAAFIDDDRFGPPMILARVAHVHMAFLYCMPCDESAHLSELYIQGVSVVGVAQ